MKNQKVSIRKMVTDLNNEESDGGFWLPTIQRPFVWGKDQIERLFDSIMREYPISTLLIWRTKSLIHRRTFIANYKVVYLCHTNEVDILILAESKISEATLLQA